jgi:Lon protease-like protein
MEEIGLFPLGIVLLPTERTPLHIFEERYKELIAECLERDREFGLVFSEESGIRTIGTRAAVIDVLQRFEDGRMNIVVEGGERFAVGKVTEGRAFDIAEVEPVEDKPGGEPEPEQVEACLEAVQEVADLAGGEIPEVDPGEPLLSFHIAGHIEFDAESKQELLEMRSERERLGRLIELLDDAAETLRFQKTARDRATGNGQVENP